LEGGYAVGGITENREEEYREKVREEAARQAQKRVQTQIASRLLEKGENLGRYGQIREAIAFYNAALRLNPEFWKAYFKLSSAYRDVRMRREELSTLQYAITVARTDRERSVILNNLSDVLSFYGNVDEAVMCLEQAMALEPENALYMGNLCAILVREKEFQRSLTLLQQLRDLVGDSASQYLSNLGMAKSGLGQYAEAAAIFEKFVELYPERKYIWRELAKVYVELERYEDAERVCREEMRPGLASYLILADARCRTGRRMEAAEMTQKALKTMKPPSYFDDVRWHYCNRVSHQELMAFVRDIAKRLDETPWPRWILARLAVILDDVETIQEELQEVLSLDETLKPAVQTDAYFQNIHLEKLLNNGK
jgi:tetratricopeptide (TPR) repeat protein